MGGSDGGGLESSSVAWMFHACLRNTLEIIKDGEFGHQSSQVTNQKEDLTHLFI